jgi:hypothetical protein
MAEVIGAIASGITLAALFQICVEAFDIIYVAKNHDRDLKLLVLKLNIEKCKLVAWGQLLGLSHNGATTKLPAPPRPPPFS